MQQPVPQPSRREQSLLTWKHVHLYTGPCLHNKQALPLNNPCISWSWRGTVPSSHRCPPTTTTTTQPLWNRVPDLDTDFLLLTDVNTCSHAERPWSCITPSPLSTTFPRAAQETVSCSLMDQCCVNLGQKAGRGDGRHMAVGCCVQLLLMICLHASCGRNYFGGSLACLSSLWGDTRRNRRSTFLAKAKKANLSWHCSDGTSATTD